MIYPTLAELAHARRRADSVWRLGVRDHGLLQSALARPQATVFGSDAYAQLEEKAAALLHSLVRNHALVDGNKRLALTATIAFLRVNGRRLTLTNDDAYDLVVSIAAVGLDEIAGIAAQIRAGSQPR